MEKLIELIISFMKEIGKTTYDISKYIYDDELKLIIIAENGKAFIDSIDIYRFLFGSDFIKWLVDKDKIEKEGGICPRKDLVQETIIRNRETNEAIGWENKYTEEEQLLMYLSIQENPIEFLISVLK